MTGNYSCLVAQFHLKRSISFHLIQVTSLSLSFHAGDNSFFFIWSNWHHIIWFYQSRLPLIPIGCDHLTWYNFQNYLPSILIVAVSWVSFWMDIESVPGRCFSNHPKQTTGKSVIDLWRQKRIKHLFIKMLLRIDEVEIEANDCLQREGKFIGVAWWLLLSTIYAEERNYPQMY